MTDILYSSTHPDEKPLILAVDDDRMQLMALSTMIEDLGYDVLEARNGVEALDVIAQNKEGISAILLDREMPELNGIEVVTRLKQDRELAKIPIVMQTGADSPEQIKEGIDAGVFYYLIKPINMEVLRSVLSSAVRESRQKRLLSAELKTHKTSFGLIEECNFKLRTLADAEQLARFLANCYPDPDRAVVGLAELFVNAVEHGNCGITYDEKTELVTTGKWREEVNRRVDLPENEEKTASVIFKKEPNGLDVTITDQGVGFEWQNFLTIDPARASDNHGRGIAQANMMSFDSLTYSDKGNEVTAHIGQEPPLDW